MVYFSLVNCLNSLFFRQFDIPMDSCVRKENSLNRSLYLYLALLLNLIFKLTCGIAQRTFFKIHRVKLLSYNIWVYVFGCSSQWIFASTPISICPCFKVSCCVFHNDVAFTNLHILYSYIILMSLGKRIMWESKGDINGWKKRAGVIL